MATIIEITSLTDPGVELFSTLTEAQLRNKVEPQKGIFIAESPKVIQVALNAGYTPVALLCERRHIEGDAKAIIAQCGEIPVYTGDRGLLEQLTGYTLTRGVLCAMRRPTERTVSDLLDSLTTAHKQQRIVAAADFSQTAQLCPVPEIIRAGHIDGSRSAHFFGEHCLQFPAVDSRPQQFISGSKPIYIQIQQGAPLQEAPVCVAPGSNLCPAALKLRMHYRKIEHRPDAEGRALRGIQRFPAAEEPGRILFTLPDHALRGIQHIRACDLRDVQRQNPV